MASSILKGFFQKTSNSSPNDVTISEIGSQKNGLDVMSFTGGFLDGVIADYYEVEYPTLTREIYTYRLGGPTGTVKATITINYQDSTKARVVNGSVVKDNL